MISIDRLNPTIERKESGEYETAETLRAEYEEYKRLEEEKRQRKKK